MTVIKISDCISQLPEGTDPLVTALHVKETAAVRHQSRVTEARLQAYNWLVTNLPQGSAVTDPMVAALLSMEAGGVGGRDGISGDATRRMSWASFLGKGRRNATDGAAWNAAIADAALETSARAPFSADDVRAILPALPVDDLEWALALTIRSARRNRFDLDQSTSWAALMREIAKAAPEGSPADKLADRFGIPRFGIPWVTPET